MDLHPGEQILFAGRPSWRSILGFYVLGFLGAIVVGIGFLKRIGTNYTITSERLHIRRGLLSRSVQQTKLERVQNVNTDQSFFERILQIGTVDFDTAGTDDSDFTFSGVANPDDVVAAVDRAQRLEPPASA